MLLLLLACFCLNMAIRPISFPSFRFIQIYLFDGIDLIGKQQALIDSCTRVLKNGDAFYSYEPNCVMWHMDTTRKCMHEMNAVYNKMNEHIFQQIWTLLCGYIAQYTRSCWNIICFPPLRISVMPNFSPFFSASVCLWT